MEIIELDEIPQEKEETRIILREKTEDFDHPVTTVKILSLWERERFIRLTDAYVPASWRTRLVLDNFSTEGDDLERENFSTIKILLLVAEFSGDSTAWDIVHGIYIAEKFKRQMDVHSPAFAAISYNWTGQTCSIGDGLELENFATEGDDLEQENFSTEENRLERKNFLTEWLKSPFPAYKFSPTIFILHAVYEPCDIKEIAVVRGPSEEINMEIKTFTRAFTRAVLKHSTEKTTIYWVNNTIPSYTLGSSQDVPESTKWTSTHWAYWDDDWDADELANAKSHPYFSDIIAIKWGAHLLYVSIMNWLCALILPAVVYCISPSYNVPWLCNTIFVMYTICVIIFEFTWMNKNHLYWKHLESGWDMFANCFRCCGYSSKCLLRLRTFLSIGIGVFGRFDVYQDTWFVFIAYHSNFRFFREVLILYSFGVLFLQFILLECFTIYQHFANSASKNGYELFNLSRFADMHLIALACTFQFQDVRTKVELHSGIIWKRAYISVARFLFEDISLGVFQLIFYLDESSNEKAKAFVLCSAIVSMIMSLKTICESLIKLLRLFKAKRAVRGPDAQNETSVCQNVESVDPNDSGDESSSIIEID